MCCRRTFASAPTTIRSTSLLSPALDLERARAQLLVGWPRLSPAVDAAYYWWTVISAWGPSRTGLTTMVVDRTVVLDAPGQSVTPSTWSGLPSIIIEVKPNLYFLPTGPRPPHPLNLLHSGRLRERFQDLRSQYSLVVVDTPPTANLADASVLASLSDGVILVARVGVTNRAGLATAATNLRASGTPILGTVVFQSSSTEPAYEMTPGSATAQTSGIHARL